MRARPRGPAIRAGGRRIRKSLSRNLKTAKQLLIELRARTERADFGSLDDVAVKDLQKQYLRHVGQTKKPNMVTRYKTDLATILAHLPAKVAAIGTTAVLDFREQRLANGSSPATVWA